MLPRHNLSVVGILGGGGTPIIYSLRDDFTTDRAAGAINGTLSEPSGHLRTVIDTNLKLSIADGEFKQATGTAANADNIHYPSYGTKAAGHLLRSDFTCINPSFYPACFDSNGLGLPVEAIFFAATGLNVLASSTSITVANTPTNGASYKAAILSRGTTTAGYYFFLKGGEFTEWTLLWAHPVGTNLATQATLSNGSTTGLYNVSSIRVADSKWLPTTIAYDTFDRANGSAGSTLSTGPEGQSIAPLEWSGGSIAGNVLVVTPSYGSDLITNGGFASDTIWTKGTGWTIGAGVASKAAGTQSDITQPVGTVNKFFEITWDVPTITVAGSFFPIFGNSGWIGRQVNTAPVTGAVSSRWQLSSATIGLRGSSTIVGTIDNVVVREIDPSSIFNVLHTSTADVFAEVAFASTSGTSAGLVVNLDDNTNPQNYVIAWHDGVNVHLDKCVGGVLTSLINATQAYSAGGYIKVAKSGSKYRLWYTNILIGTEQTITDAGIISNTRHGVFSTNVANGFNNFALYARGTNGEYAALDAF